MTKAMIQAFTRGFAFRERQLIPTGALRLMVKFLPSPILLKNKTVFQTATYCFCHCFLYPKTEYILQDVSLRKYLTTNERELFVFFLSSVSTAGRKFSPTLLITFDKIKDLEFCRFSVSRQFQTTATVEHGAQNQKCLKKRVFFKLLFREQMISSLMSNR